MLFRWQTWPKCRRYGSLNRRHPAELDDARAAEPQIVGGISLSTGTSRVWMTDAGGTHRSPLPDRTVCTGQLMMCPLVMWWVGRGGLASVGQPTSLPGQHSFLTRGSDMGNMPPWEPNRRSNGAATFWCTTSDVVGTHG
jgi:hypothetical protein